MTGGLDGEGDDVSGPIDLNEVRARVLAAQRAGDVAPTEPQAQVLVDREGRLRLGEDAAGGAARELSRVHKGTFAADALAERYRRDASIVAAKLPVNAVPYANNGCNGWIYNIVDEFGSPYEMFLYFDGSSYQVYVVHPEVEGKFNPHHGHLFNDGRICFGADMRSVEEAYAKSVLWANGFTTFQATGTFQFSANNGARA